MNENYKVVKKLLDTNDTETIRTTVENFQLVEMPDKVVEYVTAKLLLDDNAVRDVIARILSHNKNQNIPKYIVPYISTDIIAARNLAGEILLNRKNNSVQAMLNYLPDANDDDQKFIIDILGLIGDKSATEEIINVLKVTKDDNVILACIEALGNLKAAEAVDDIISIYDNNELFQPTIIEALGKIGTPECINFINANYYGVDELTKFPLIESLGEIGNKESFDMLIADLQYLESAYKWVAIEAIGKLQERLNLELPADKTLRTSLIETLESQDEQYKKSAIKLIKLFDGEKIIEYTFGVYGKDEDVDQLLKEYYQKHSNLFFKKITDYMKTNPANLKQAVELIKEIIQYDGGESLQELNDLEFRAFVEVFTVLLLNPDEEIRSNAIELLFFLDAEIALQFSDTMLEDPNSWNRLKLLEIIQHGDDQRIIDIIKELANDKDEVVRENAQNILNERGLSNLKLKEQ